MNEIYPLTIVKDRYGGTYSGGKFTAWNLDSHKVPSDIHADDITVMEFFNHNNIIFGRGDNPHEAVDDLKIKLNLKKEPK